MENRHFLILLLLFIHRSSENEGPTKKVYSTAAATTHNQSGGLNTDQPYAELYSTLGHIERISNNIMIGASVIGIITNTLLILVVFIDPLKRLRASKCTLIIVSISLADLLTSWVTLFYGMQVPLPNGSSQNLAVLLWVGFTASLANLFVFTFERFLVTLYPFKAKLFISYRGTALACLASWIVGVVIAVNGHFIFTTNLQRRCAIWIFQIAFLELMVVVMVLLNICIIFSICKHNSRMNGELLNNKSKKTLRQMNTVLTILIILLIITTMPFLINVHIFYLIIWCNESSLKCLPVQLSTFIKISALTRCFLPFGAINFLVNPIIYAWRLDDYRESAKAVVSKKHRLQSSSTTNKACTQKL